MSQRNMPLPPLILPGLRAAMGDWVYYICFLKMQDISIRISIVKEIHSSESLRDLLQRELQSRSSEIADYLLSQEQRFFNALVVGTYGGSPTWYELDISNSESDLGMLPDDIEGTLGLLKLNGGEKLFAIDGQHRVAGIREAIERQPELGSEEVCVIFLASVTQEHRNDDPAGFQRTRRLFTTLNRYAKPVGKKDIIALDEDDIIAILTRQLVEEYPLFYNTISLSQQKNIPPTDQRNFTTIVTLYDTLDIYFKIDNSGHWKKFKRKRPSDEEIADFFNDATYLWDAITEYFVPLRELKQAEIKGEVVGRYRHEFGGHLLFRPVGLLIVFKVIRALVDSQVPLTQAVQLISNVPMELAKSPWADLLWDTVNERMLTAPENQKVAVQMLFYGVGGDLSKLPRGLRTDNLNNVRTELAGLLKKNVADVEIRRYV